jgi:anti-sigma-K factor RskA
MIEPSIDYAETIMNQPVSIDAALTTERSETKHADSPFAIWALILVVAAVACAVLALDASLTPEQRILVFQQSGIFP